MLEQNRTIQLESQDRACVRDDTGKLDGVFGFFLLTGDWIDRLEMFIFMSLFPKVLAWTS